MANRKVIRLNEEKHTQVDPFTIKDAEYIYYGHMVQMDSNEEVAPAADTASVDVVGVATKEVDNTDDGEECTFLSNAICAMLNAGDITRVNVGTDAYVLDSETVSLSANLNSNVAGPIVEVTSDFVFVDFDPAK